MRVWWVVVVLCVPLVTAEWFAVDADLDVHGAARFDGDADVRMVFSGSMLDARDDPLANGRLEATGDWTYTYYEVTERYVEGSDGSAVGTRRIDLSRDLEVLDEGTIEGALSTEGLDPAFSLRAFQYEGRPVNWSTSFALGPPSDPHTYYGSKRSVEVVDDPRTRLPERGARWLPDQNIEMEGDFRFQLYGTLVSAEGRTFPTGLVDEESVEAPDGTTRVDTRVHRILVVEGPGKANLVGQWTHYVTSLDGRLGGSLEMAQARGRADVNGSQVSEEPQLFHVIGDVQSEAEYHFSSSHWRIQGSASFVSVNADPVAGSWPQAEMAAAAIAVGLLAAWAWASGLLREIALLLGVNRADPLLNPTRRTIFRAIVEEPGATRMHLARRTGASRSSIRHHIRILQAAGLVHGVRKGKIPRYLPNGGTTTFPAPLPGNARGRSTEATMVVRDWFARQPHELQKWVMKALTGTGMTTRELLQESQGRQGRKPTEHQIRYHCGVLHRAGLLGKHRRGRDVVWIPVHDVEAIQAEYSRRRTQGLEQERSTLGISG